MLIVNVNAYKENRANRAQTFFLIWFACAVGSELHTRVTVCSYVWIKKPNEITSK